MEFGGVDRTTKFIARFVKAQSDHRAGATGLAGPRGHPGYGGSNGRCRGVWACSFPGGCEVQHEWILFRRLGPLWPVLR